MQEPADHPHACLHELFMRPSDMCCCTSHHQIAEDAPVYRRLKGLQEEPGAAPGAANSQRPCKRCSP